MRVPLSWLRDLVPTDLDVDDVAERLTLAGIEVEAIERIGTDSDRLVVGEIVSAEALDKRNTLMKVNVGEDAPVSVVTNVPAIAALPAGTRAAVALDGAILFDANGTPVPISKTTVSGADSAGVFCSPAQLGIGDDATTVAQLPPETAPGTPVRDVAGGAGETVLELAILPNIARCQSMIGVAREVAAITQTPADIEVGLAEELDLAGDLTPNIEATEDCHRFAVARIEGVRVCPSPEWMQRKLRLCGVEPINNLVDASNYVLIEMGQPTHAYDAERLASPILGVRRSKAGETIHVLTQADDQPPLELPEDVLLIDCEGTPVAVAGIVGGTETAIADATTTVLLESANFGLLSVRRGQRLVNVFTESSARFSRGVDPALVEPAMRRFLHLVRETCPEAKLTATGQWSDGSENRRLEVEIDIAEANQALGTDFSLSDAADALERVSIACEADEATGRIRTTLTSARLDLALKCDLYEEIARLLGYDRMPQTLPMGTVEPPEAATELTPRNRVRELLISQGLSELISYSLSSPEVEQALDEAHPDERAATTYFEVVNPISVERRVMRRSLLPGLLGGVNDRLKAGELCCLFEVGSVFIPNDDSDLTQLADERLTLGIVMAGQIVEPTMHEPEPRPVDFFDLKGVCETLLQSAPAYTFEKCEGAPYQPGQTAQVLVNDSIIGRLGKVHPSVCEAFDIDGVDVYAAEWSLQALLDNSRETFTVREPSRYPSIEIDISFILDSDVEAAGIAESARTSGGAFVDDVTFVGVYAGPPIPEGRKSVTIRVVLNARERSMRTEEAMEIREAIVERVREAFGAEVRE